MKPLATDRAPQAIGPYSQGIDTNALVFVSGQIPLDPATGQTVPGGIAEQTDRVLRSIAGILMSAGLSMDHVVKTTVYLVDLGEFSAMNEVYGRHFKAGCFPARATVQVSALPKGARVEIDAIASR